jgi:hypothetical protein
MCYRADEPLWDKRDYLIMSKGHAVSGNMLYLQKPGFFRWMNYGRSVLLVPDSELTQRQPFRELKCIRLTWSWIAILSGACSQCKAEKTLIKLSIVSLETENYKRAAFGKLQCP